MGTRQDGIARKQEILEAALSLFERIGYENTTVQNILDEVGIGKGTFYHHFSSREEVLDNIVDENIESVQRILEAVAEDTSLTAIEKLRKLIVSVQNYRNRNTARRFALIRILMREENHTLAYKYTERVVEQTLDLYTKVIAQGNEESIFDAPYPRKTAEMIIRMGNHFRGQIEKMKEQVSSVADSRREAREHEISEIIGFMHIMTVRMLGIPAETLDITSMLTQTGSLEEPQT